MSFSTMKKIASGSVTASGGAIDIDFQNISQAFDDLLILGSFRSTGSEEVTPPIGRLELLINNTSTGNLYTVRLLYGLGSGTPGSASGANANRNFYSGSAAASGATASTFSNVSYYLPNYTGSTNKSFSIDSVTENNGTGADASFTAGLWASTAAITRLTLKMYSGSNLAQYSTATLYGIRKS